MSKKKLDGKNYTVSTSQNTSGLTSLFQTPLLLALIISFISFSPSLSNKFVNWDDDVNVLENKNIEILDLSHVKKIFSDDVIGNYNPLPILTFAIEKNFVGFEPKLYHIDNLILHLLCVFLVFRLCLLLGLNPWFAGLVAALFGFHPMRVESVAWITERKDVLFGFFYLWALCLYTKWVKKPNGNLTWVWICLLAILALLSKIQAVSLPLSMLAIDYLLKREWHPRIIAEKLPLFFLSAVFGLLGIYMLKDNASLDDATHYNFFERLVVGAYSFVVYLIKFVFPYMMSPLYAYPEKIKGEMYFAIIPALGVLAYLVYLIKKGERIIAFGLLFFIVNVVFVLQILAAGQGFLADRFTYIPYLGLFISVAFLLQEKMNQNSKNVVLLGCSLYLAMSAFMTFKQTKIWENGETLWSHVMKHETKTPLPFTNRAMYYRGLGTEYRTQAIALKNQGLAEKGNEVLAKSNSMFESAMNDFNAALKLKEQAATYNSIGKLFFDQGKVEPALDNYNRAVQLDGTKGEFLINRGAAFASGGKYQEALNDLNKGVSLDSNNINGYLNRSLLHYTMGNYRLAIDDHNQYLGRVQNNPEMVYERGICFAALGKYTEAVKDFDTAISMGPEGLFYQERGKAHFMLGNKAQAQNDIRKAMEMGLQVDPGILQQVGVQ